MEAALNNAIKFGIATCQEAPDVSHYTGEPTSDYKGQSFDMKVKGFSQVQDPEEVKKSIFANNQVPILVMKSSVELYFDDLGTDESKAVSDDLITFGIVGFEEKDNLWILNNNFQANWSRGGFTRVPQNSKDIVGIYVAELQ